MDQAFSRRRHGFCLVNDQGFPELAAEVGRVLDSIREEEKKRR